MVVARPTRWGNPFRIGGPDPESGAPPTRERTVALYRSFIRTPEQASLRQAARRELRGKALACWCPLDAACHADELMTVANED